jgi:hypothetical protein
MHLGIEQLHAICFKIFNSINKHAICFYDYIRSLKPAFIRYLKNISFLLTSVLFIAIIIVITRPAAKTNNRIPVNANPADSYNQKVQNQKDKQNSIMRRFISYTNAREFN